MLQVFCFIESDSIRSLLELNLKLHLGVSLHHFSSLDDLCVSITKKAPDIVLVEFNGESFGQKLESLPVDSVYITFGNIGTFSKSSLHIEDLAQWPLLIKFLKKRWPEVTAQLDQEKYVPINLFYFMSLGHGPYDIYSKQTKDGVVFYRKEFAAFADIDQEKLKELKIAGVDSLYIHSKKRIEFLSYVNSELLKGLSKKVLSSEISLGETYQLVRGLINNIGLTPEIVKVCEKVAKELESKVVQDTSLKNYLEKLKSDEGFIFSYKLGQLAYLLAVSAIPYFNKSEDQQSELIEKFAYTSFLRDISIEVDDWEKLRTNKDLENNKSLTSQQKMDVYYHAKEAVHFAERIPGIPKDSLAMIREHHGSRLGEGFSEKIKDDLTYLSKVYILMEDLAFRILMNCNKKDHTIENEIDQLCNAYPYTWAHEILIPLRKATK